MNLPSWQPLYYLPRGVDSILDVGCNVGDLLDQARKLGVKHCFGMDINQNAIQKAQARFSRDANFKVVQGSCDNLDFIKQEIDVVTFCEVIEHVPESLRSAALKEIARTMRPGGTLILTTPFKGLFHWLDPANVRLLFPKLFHFFSQLVGGKGREDGFVGQKHGIVWHHHFTMQELEHLLLEDFEIQKIRMRGILLAPLMQYILFYFYRREDYNHILYRLARWLKEAELLIDPPKWLAFNIMVIATKKKDDPNAP